MSLVIERRLVAISGLEPELFALRGRRVNQLHHIAIRVAAAAIFAPAHRRRLLSPAQSLSIYQRQPGQRSYCVSARGRRKHRPAHSYGSMSMSRCSQDMRLALDRRRPTAWPWIGSFARDMCATRPRHCRRTGDWIELELDAPDRLVAIASTTLQLHGCMLRSFLRLSSLL